MSIKELPGRNVMTGLHFFYSLRIKSNYYFLFNTVVLSVIFERGLIFLVVFVILSQDIYVCVLRKIGSL